MLSSLRQVISVEGWIPKDVADVFLRVFGDFVNEMVQLDREREDGAKVTTFDVVRLSGDISVAERVIPLSVEPDFSSVNPNKYLK